MIEFDFKPHPALMDAYLARHEDEHIGLVTLVTGPKGIGLMGNFEPGRDETTYEVVFPGSPDPIGYLTLGETVGIIKYLRVQAIRGKFEACAELVS